MLAKTRPYFLLAFLALTACVPVGARAQDRPSSFTSFGIEGNADASGRTSLASLGRNGFPNALQPFLGNCCVISFLAPPLASEIKPPFAPEYGRHQDDADDALMPIVVPVYIPYAIGYEPDEIADAQEETAPDESTLAYGPGQVAGNQSGPSDDAYRGPAMNDEAAAELPEPVDPQPATVLVYKDGHRAKVVNYAILGDALFDFDDEHTSKIPLADLDLPATEKANDAAGVDFKLPASMIGSAP